MFLIMDQKIHEELLFAKTLTTDTKEESIFNFLKNYFMEKAVSSSNKYQICKIPT